MKCPQPPIVRCGFCRLRRQNPHLTKIPLRTAAGSEESRRKQTWRVEITNRLVIIHKSARRRESDLLVSCTPQILRCAQDDKSPAGCHPERSEGSRADL